MSWQYKQAPPWVVAIVLLIGIGVVGYTLSVVFRPHHEGMAPQPAAVAAERSLMPYECTDVDEALQKYYGGALIKSPTQLELPRRQFAEFVCHPGDYRGLGNCEIALMKCWKSAVIVDRQSRKLANGQAYESIIISRYPLIP